MRALAADIHGADYHIAGQFVLDLEIPILHSVILSRRKERKGTCTEQGILGQGGEILGILRKRKVAVGRARVAEEPGGTVRGERVQHTTTGVLTGPTEPDRPPIGIDKALARRPADNLCVGVEDVIASPHHPLPVAER